MFRIESHLRKVPLERLRPTQMTVGFHEVEAKRKSWRKLGGEARKRAMNEELFPAVIGPGKVFYILDHHHTALALAHEKADSVQVGSVKDLSHLRHEDFWVFLDHHCWVHMYDAKGRRQPVDAMPERFAELEDDPYRSLAGLVRDAGGFAKAEEPFLEFLWANHFRRRVALRLVKSDLKRACRVALALAHDKEAAHLPGWCGKR